MSLTKRIALGCAAAASILLPVAPATGKREESGTTEVIPDGDIIVDDGSVASKLSAEEHVKLEASTYAASMSCNPFCTEIVTRPFNKTKAWENQVARFEDRHAKKTEIVGDIPAIFPHEKVGEMGRDLEPQLLGYDYRNGTRETLL